MNKQDLIKHLAANADVSNKQAEAVLNALTTTVLDTVRSGNELAITDLGKFSTAQRAAKTGRNPKTGEALKIAATTVPTFKAGAAFKAAVAPKKKAKK